MLRTGGARATHIETERLASLRKAIAEAAHPLQSPKDLGPIIDQAARAKYVLLGEASHGTSEYYLWRARISRQLITEHGFSFIAVEGDWPDCYSVNRYVKGYDGTPKTAFKVLGAFDRWPTWMWANWEMIALAEWLRKFNDRLPQERKVGFYGLDVYSLWDSMRELVGFLKRVNPDAAESAVNALRCFESYGEEAQDYAWATRLVPESCEQEVAKLLTDVRTSTRNIHQDHEAALNAEQNANVAVNAERYYRTMIGGGPESWNVRDTHMADTLDHLMEHHGPDAKGIVWEHNTHIGDARATDMVREGEVNVGQLMRERHARDGVFVVGFSGYQGTVIAGRQWDAPMEVMNVPPGEDGSWEDMLHRALGRNSQLILSDLEEWDELHELRGHRAIGVVYRPAYERLGNYVPTALADRYDALMYFDNTRALHPLGIKPHVEREPPETYPWGM